MATLTTFIQHSFGVLATATREENPNNRVIIGFPVFSQTNLFKFQPLNILALSCFGLSRATTFTPSDPSCGPHSPWGADIFEMLKLTSGVNSPYAKNAKSLSLELEKMLLILLLSEHKRTKIKLLVPQIIQCLESTTFTHNSYANFPPQKLPLQNWAKYDMNGHTHGSHPRPWAMTILHVQMKHTMWSH